MLPRRDNTSPTNQISDSKGTKSVLSSPSPIEPHMESKTCRRRPWIDTNFANQSKIRYLHQPTCVVGTLVALLWPMSFANMPQVSGMCEAVSHSNPSSSVATHLELSSPHSTAHEELCLQQVSWKRKLPSSDPCISRRFGPCFGVCLPYEKKHPLKAAVASWHRLFR